MIIGISGYAGSGKDTVALTMRERGFQRIAFADSLKTVALACNPDLRETVDQWGWDEAKRFPEHRQFLQDLGKGVRDHLSPDAWVDRVFRRIMDEYSNAGPTKWVITDVRMPNEYDAVKAHGGQVWRVTRPGVAPVNRHISETALDGYDFDQHIPNDGGLTDLRHLVRGLLDLLTKETLA